MEAVKLLIESGTDITVELPDGRSPLALACEKKNYELISYLIEQPEANFTGISKSGSCIFHTLAGFLEDQKGREVFYKICEKLEYRTDLSNIIDDDGYSPIHRYYMKWNSFLFSQKGALKSKWRNLYHEEVRKRNNGNNEGT